MKVKRYKKFQRYMGFFQKNYHFKPPYNVLVDGTFVHAALTNKVNMKEQIPKYLDAAAHLVTTPCVQIETEKLGPQLYGTLQIVKQLKMISCGHESNPLEAEKCILSTTRKAGKANTGANEEQPNVLKKCIVATQDQALRERLREIPGIPLIYLYGPAPTMEKPSDISEKVADKKNLERMEVLDYQKEILDKMKQDELGESAGPGRKGTKKRKRLGPNPLSCKKSKKKNLPGPSSTANTPVQKRKRKRVKVKIPKHVKQARQS